MLGFTKPTNGGLAFGRRKGLNYDANLAWAYKDRHVWGPKKSRLKSAGRAGSEFFFSSFLLAKSQGFWDEHDEKRGCFTGFGCHSNKQSGWQKFSGLLQCVGKEAEVANGQMAVGHWYLSEQLAKAFEPVHERRLSCLSPNEVKIPGTQKNLLDPIGQRKQVFETCRCCWGFLFDPKPYSKKNKMVSAITKLISARKLFSMNESESPKPSAGMLKDTVF